MPKFRVARKSQNSIANGSPPTIVVTETHFTDVVCGGGGGVRGRMQIFYKIHLVVVDKWKHLQPKKILQRCLMKKDTF